MRRATWYGYALMACIACAGVSFGGAQAPIDRPLSTRDSTDQALRKFALYVADDVTRDGPSAWRRHFSDRPAFFMVSNGQLVFSNGEEASKGIAKLEKSIRHIELRWGKTIRIDSLAPGLAMLAMPYFEAREDSEGHSVREAGYFTGLAEFRDGRWQFRDAHWSVPVPASAVK